MDNMPQISKERMDLDFSQGSPEVHIKIIVELGILVPLANRIISMRNQYISHRVNKVYIRILCMKLFP